MPLKLFDDESGRRLCGAMTSHNIGTALPILHHALTENGQVFTHIVVGANDLAAAKHFYDRALGALGHGPGAAMGDRVIYGTGSGILMVTKPLDGQPAGFGNGMTIGLSAPNVAAVDAFHAQGVAAGGRCAGAPGPRDAIPNSYAAYLRDPTGNKLVAWCVAGADEEA